MAITNSDGSIVLTTKVEDAGLKKGMAKIISDQKTQLQSLTREYAKLITNNKQNTEEAKKLKDQIDKLSKSIKENEGVLQSFEKTSTGAFSRVGSALKSIAGYLALAFSVTKLISFSNEAGQLATQTEASVQRLADIYGSASDSVGDFIDANARALGMSKAAAASFSSVYGNLFSAWADQATNAELTNRYLNMTAVVASKTGRTVEDVQERIRSGLLGNTEAIEDLGIFVNVKTIEMTDAFQRMASGKSWEQLDAYTQQQVRTMAILEQATAKYGNTVADTTATTRAQYQAAYEDFKNTWGQVVNTVLIPVLKILTQVFTIATKGLQILAGLSGKTVDNSKLQESSISGAVENQKDLTEAVKGTNKELKKSLAGFDEINTLSKDNVDGGALGATDVAGGVGGIGGVGANYDNSFVEKIDADLAEIMGYVGFALAAIGIILICFGHIGWGIGFLIAGAAIFSVSQAALSEGAELEKVKNIMNGVIAGISLLALVLGIILVCTTKNPKTLALGIGLIVAGATGLAIEAAINWDFIVEQMQGTFGKIMAIVSVGLLVIGLILLFVPGAQGLALGLIIAGAAGLATVIAFNWNFIVDKVKEVWQKVKNFWNSYIAPIFTAKWWADLGKKAINGLLGVIESGLNWIIDKINVFIGGLSKIVGAVGDVIGVDWNIPKIPRVSIPRLAQGAVIPPNREFLAVLGDQKSGTNIEAPLNTIKQAVAEVLAQANIGGGFNGRIEVPVIIDGREVARAVREAEGNMGTQTVYGGFANVH